MRHFSRIGAQLSATCLLADEFQSALVVTFGTSIAAQAAN